MLSLVVGALMALRLSGGSPGQAVEYSLSITAWTDVLTAVPSSKVRVMQGTQNKTFLTDATGSTSPFAILPDVPFTLTLEQKTVPSGLAIGQVLSECTIPTAPAGQDSSGHVFLLFQPVLEPAVFDSGEPHPVQSSSHDRWFVLPNQGASYLFPANVGILMTSREVQAFASYYGVPLAHEDYRAGLVISTGDPEVLGAVGARLMLRFDSYGFDQAPAVDRYFVASSPANLGTADFQAVATDWEPLVERADYDITGTLGDGLNVLLFRDGSPEELIESLASTPLFPPPTSSTGFGVQDCQPETPTPSGQDSCPVTPPPSDPGCPAGGCSGEPSCTAQYTPAGSPVCGGGGGATTTKKVGVTTTVSGGVSGKVSVMGSEITPSVGAGSSHSEEVIVGLGDGAHGCGQCVQVFKRIVRCTQPCIIEKNAGRTLGGGVLCLDGSATGSCVDTSGTSTSLPCDRTGC